MNNLKLRFVMVLDGLIASFYHYKFNRIARAKKKEEDDTPLWAVGVSGLLLVVILSYAILVTSGHIDPYANQRIEMNFTVRSMERWEDPRWSEDRWLLSTFERGVFFLQLDLPVQLNVGDTYRMVYKNTDINEIASYHAFI